MTRTPWEITREMFLSEQEVASLLRHIRSKVNHSTGDQLASTSLDRLLIETLLFSGLRNSEFCRLQIGDTIVATGRSAFTVGDEAAGEEQRVVHIPREVSVLVIDYVSTIRAQFLPADISSSDRQQPLVFHERHRPFERTGLYRRVVRILTEAGLGDRASVQLLRHTYGYLAYSRTKGNLLFVQRQLGHAHPMVTAVYAQFYEENHDQLTEEIYGTAIDIQSQSTKRRKKSH